MPVKKNNICNCCTILFSLVFIFSCFIGKAQIADTSNLYLNEVVISDKKQIVIQSNKKTISIDSTILKLNIGSSLSDLLSSQTPIYIKTYGNGNIATTSMRGGSANQTAVLWNGLQIQNPMLGQTDLSLIQSNLFSNIMLEFGSGSAAWGSGAIGGSIHLNNKLEFNQPFKTTTFISYGSFNTKKLNTSVIISNKKFASRTAPYYTDSKNNYTFLDTTNKEQQKQTVAHANYITKGIMQEFAYKINVRQTIGLNFWYNNTDRNLPSYSQITSKKNQLDENLRININWQLNKYKLKSEVKAAYFKDILNYSDSTANLFSTTKVNTFIIQNENTYQIKKGMILFGSNYTLYKTDTQNYDTLRSLNKIAIYGGYNVSFFKSKINYTLFLRKEITNQTLIPFTGNTGFLYHINKLFSSKINASKSYRQPSLNDLYWKQGGNANLKPEDSYEIDGSIILNKQLKKFNFNVEGTYFNRHTTNWIVWLPSDKGYWTPRNILEVYSRGAETKTHISYLKKDILLQLNVNTSYILSTNTKSVNENDNSVGRQLMYSPRYTGQLSFLLQYKNIKLLYSYNYIGYRFTSTDNTSWLNPYHLNNIKLSTSYKLKYYQLNLYTTINNLFNKNYIIVQNNPMPLRNYEIGISFQYQKTKSI